MPDKPKSPAPSAAGPARPQIKPGDILAAQERNAKPKPAKAEPAPERVAAFQTGLSAESRAAAFLLAKGYRILARRYRTPAGEIDIIARRRHTLVFVEVKARSRLDDAAESVTLRQRSRIAAAAEIWLAKFEPPGITDMRFDAMLVAPGCIPRHISGAFETN